MLDHGAQRGRHQQRQAGPPASHISQPGARVKAAVQGDRRTRMQGGQHLNAEPAHMEHRQCAEYMVVRRQLMRMDGNHAVPDHPGLGVQHTLGLAAGSRGIDQQHRGIRVAVEFELWLGRHRVGKFTGPQKTTARLRRQGCCSFLMYQVGYQQADTRMGEDGCMFRCCEAIVERQNDGANARQRKQQHQQIRMVQTQPGDPVAGPHAGHPQYGGRAFDTPPELRIADVAAFMVQRQLVR